MFPTARTHIAAAFFAMLAFAFFANRSNADFSGPYALPEESHYTLPISPAAFGTWTFQASGIYYSYSYLGTGPTTVVFITGSSTNHNFSDYFDLQLTHTIPANGILSFDYSISLVDNTFATSSFNYGGYILDGVLVKLPAGSGSITVPVKAGDSFGFDAYAGPNCILCGPPANVIGGTTMTVTNFNAPVPEPFAITFLLLGIAGLAITSLKERVINLFVSKV